jgi:hypothetical protein
MLSDMRRLSIVPLIAAAIVLGHVVPHLLVTHHRMSRGRSAPAAALRLGVNRGSPPLVAPTCRLQPPPVLADREPMLDALRRLIATEEERYPYLADNDRTIAARFAPCGVVGRSHSRLR